MEGRGGLLFSVGGRPSWGGEPRFPFSHAVFRSSFRGVFEEDGRHGLLWSNGEGAKKGREVWEAIAESETKDGAEGVGRSKEGEERGVGRARVLEA